MTTYKPGDPCPHCGVEGRIKFNGGDLICLACGRYVDDERRPVIEVERDPDGTFHAR